MGAPRKTMICTGLSNRLSYAGNSLAAHGGNLMGGFFAGNGLGPSWSLFTAGVSRFDLSLVTTLETTISASRREQTWPHSEI